MAQESVAEELAEDVLPEGMKILELPGHSFEMTGFLTKDNTAYIADCVSSEETLSKYGIGYLWNPEESVKTLEYVKTLEAARFVPSHAPVTEDVTGLADFNIRAVTGVRNTVAKLISEPMTFEEILEKVFDEYGLSMNAQQYVLIGSTVRSYLSSMYQQGEAEYSFDGNRMIWKVKEQKV